MGKAIEDALNTEDVIHTDTNETVRAVVYASKSLPLSERKLMEYNYVDVFIFDEKDELFNSITSILWV